LLRRLCDETLLRFWGNRQRRFEQLHFDFRVGLHVRHGLSHVFGSPQIPFDAIPEGIDELLAIDVVHDAGRSDSEHRFGLRGRRHLGNFGLGGYL
jgi:hypothetical protein